MIALKVVVGGDAKMAADKSGRTLEFKSKKAAKAFARARSVMIDSFEIVDGDVTLLRWIAS